MNQTENLVTPSSEILTPEKIYNNQRRDWNEKILGMANAQRDIMQIANVQIDLYSNRHRAVDEIHTLLNLHVKVSERNKIARGEARKKLENTDLKVKDTNEQVDAATAQIKTALDQIANQIDFLREVIKTVDAMLYGIKHRIDFENNYRRLS